MLIKLFKLQFSSFIVPFKKLLIFYRQMSEIKTWVFRRETSERLKETDFAGEINIMFMCLFLFLKNWLSHFLLMLGRVRGMCPCQVNKNQQSHQCVDFSCVSFLRAAQMPGLHSPRFDPALPTKAAPALILPHKWRADEHPKWAVLAKNMFRFKGKGNKPNLSLELSSGNHHRSDFGFSLLNSAKFPLHSKSIRILKWPLTLS